MPMTSYGIDPGLSRLFPQKKGGAWPQGGKGGQTPVALMPTLDPNQQALAEQLTQMLSGVQTPSNYLAGLTQFTSGAGATPFGGPAGNAVLAAIQDALSGKVSEEYFQGTIAGPARKYWEEVGAPAVGEEFVGPGTYWGTARGQAVERGRQAVESDISATRGTMANEALGRALQAALGYGGLMSQNLGNWIQAYIAANPSVADTMNAILAYLGTPTQLAYQDPEYIPSAIQEALGAGTSTWKRWK